MDAFFLNPDGQVIAVDAAQAHLVSAARGYTPATPQQIEDYQAAEKFGSPGQTALAGAEALGRGLTARLSTVAERALGVPAADISGREAAHPALSTVAEGAGVALPLVATMGGASAFTAPSLIGRAGAATGEMAARALPEAAGVLGRVGVAAARTAAAGATEGALYGAGNVVHEAALGDPTLTGESALARVGLSTALGAGLGGVLGGTGQAFREAVTGARAAVGKIAGVMSTPERLGEAVQEHYTAMRGATREFNAAVRPAETEGLIAQEPMGNPWTGTRDAAAMQEAGRLTGRIGDVIDEMRAKPELYPQAMYPAKLEAVRDAITRDIDGASAAEIFDALDTAKRNIDKQLGKWGKMIAPEAQDSISAIRNVRGELKQSLEDVSVWGKAAARQAAANDAQAEFLDAQKDFQKEFMRKMPGRGVMPTFEADPAKLARLSDTANPAYPRRQAVFARYQEASSKLLGEMEQSHANAPVSSFDKDALEAVINKTGEVEQRARQQGAVMRMLGNVGGSIPFAAAAGHVVGGPVGAAIGAGVGVLGKAAKFIPHAADVLSRLNANNEAMQAAIEKGAIALAKGGAGVARAARSEVSAGIGRAFSDDAETASAKFQKHAEKLRGISGDPANMSAALEELAADLTSHAPNTAQAMMTTSARAVTFLTSKMPAIQKAGPLGPELRPSAGQIATYNRYREAVEDPLSILRQAKAGTLTREGIEAVQTVYPALYAKIQATAFEKMASSKNIPYASRLMLALLVGHDVDGTLVPAMTLPPPPAPRPSAGKAKFTLPDRMKLGSRRAAEGRER